MPTLEWSPSYSPALMLSAAGALLLVLLAARVLARSPTARSWSLLLVRGSVLAVLLGLLLNPVRVTQNRLPPQAPEVVYLVDCSRSMALDKPSSRLEQVKHILAQTKRALPADVPTSVKLYRFGQDLRALRTTEELDANDDATRLRDSLERLLPQFETLPKSVVLFSDGRTTEPGNDGEVAAAYRRLKVPIHVFPVGDPNAAGDIAIQDVIAPRDASPGSRVPIRVVTRSHGFAGRRAEVRIRSLKDPQRPALASVPVTLKEGQQQHELVLTHDPAAGQLVVEVPPLDGEATEENNRVPFSIGARKGKIRVIYMEGTVSPAGEYRFIRDALQEDPNIECVCLEVNDQNAAQPILFRVDDPSRGFPNTRAELFTYDV
ncbi:MAG TPA: vWA domain-containing protein, partial [Gemmataceae bacterium]|nr:vWA domain-containing protein [Gemmataceae bacterium]